MRWVGVPRAAKRDCLQPQHPWDVHNWSRSLATSAALGWAGIGYTQCRWPKIDEIWSPEKNSLLVPQTWKIDVAHKILRELLVLNKA